MAVLLGGMTGLYLGPDVRLESRSLDLPACGLGAVETGHPGESGAQGGVAGLEGLPLTT